MKTSVLSGAALAALLLAMGSGPAHAAMNMAVAATIRLDCSAFRKALGGRWITTKPTKVIPGPDDNNPEMIGLSAGMSFGRNHWMPAGVDLAKLLDLRCPRGD